MRLRSCVVVSSVLLASCSAGSGTNTTADAALTDAEAILATLEAAHAMPTALEADAGKAVAALGTIITSAATAGGSSRAAALAAADAAVHAIMADAPGEAVQMAGSAALAALDASGAGESGDAAAEAAVGALLLDGLATERATRTLASSAVREAGR